ncbi:hypothetical protein DFJ74DRAFT_229265 [Hyaloraphidium curvatum]|nr:hypothetical protein DFJ74DRAFT_229265 [Hyaloraphidium curvatum]
MTINNHALLVLVLLVRVCRDRLDARLPVMVQEVYNLLTSLKEGTELPARLVDLEDRHAYEYNRFVSPKEVTIDALMKHPAIPTAANSACI